MPTDLDDMIAGYESASRRLPRPDWEEPTPIECLPVDAWDGGHVSVLPDAEEGGDG